MAKNVAERVKTLRLERRWTQKELAVRAGIAFGTFQAFELNGKISLERLCRVSVALGRAGEIETLFAPAPLRSIDELIEKPQPKRGRAAR